MDQVDSKPTSSNPPEAMGQTAGETLPGDRLYPQGMPRLEPLLDSNRAS